MEVKVIGICGGTGSGKSTVVRKISEVCPQFVIIEQDNYYKSADFVNNSNITAVNFDRPDAFDSDLLHKHLYTLKAGGSIEMPQYDFVKHKRMDETVHVEPAPLIILDGLFILNDPEIRKLLDLKIFVDTPADIRFIRRLQRDIQERGRTMESVIKQYLEVVRPGHQNYIEPTKEFADIIIPEGGYNEKAMSVIISFVTHIND
ncbi:MAG: uridine kinase [Sphaerochaetaceae bacterium]|nr:uridine kinase [Sphaerochaetaceae bacterium]